MIPKDKLGEELYHSYCATLNKSLEDSVWEWDNWVEGIMTKAQWQHVAELFKEKL